MDWARPRGEFLNRDKDGVFRYGTGECTVIRKLETDGDCKRWTNSSADDWMSWFNKDHLTDSGQRVPGVGLILSARSEENDDDDDDETINGTDTEDQHDPHIIERLPFDKSVLDLIVERFFVHGSVPRALQRGYAFFSRTALYIGSENAITYICRASHHWPGDMALSTTYFPKTGFSYGIIYGCTPATRQQVIGRIANSGVTISHPLLLPGIFAELERQRQLNIVKVAVKILLQTVADLSTKGSDYRAVAPKGDGSKHAIYPWLKIHHLKNGLENWKAQLLKMVEHVDELSSGIFAPGHGPVRAGRLVNPQIIRSDEIDEGQKSALRETGNRIQERLREIIHDYDEKIRECVMIMEGMTLATQLAHTKANMEIAISTRKDGSQMKSIAILTMVFLPGTFLATLFSMSFFKWDANADQGEALVSPLLWVYVLIAIVLTAATLAIYIWWSGRGERKLKMNEALTMA